MSSKKAPKASLPNEPVVGSTVDQIVTNASSNRKNNSDLELASFDAAIWILSDVDNTQAIVACTADEDKKRLFFRFAEILIGTGFVIRDDIEATLAKIRSYWKDDEINVALSNMAFPVSQLTMERLLVEDVETSVEFLISHGVVQDPAQALPEGQFERLSSFADSTGHMDRRDKVAAVKHMWVLFATWRDAPSPEFLSWMHQNQEVIQDTDWQFMLKKMRGQRAATRISHEGKKYLHRVLESPHLYSRENLASTEFRLAVPHIARLVFGIDPDDIESEFLSAEVSHRATAMFYRAFKVDLLPTMTAKDLRSAYFVSGAADIFGDKPPSNIPGDLWQAVASTMYYRRVRHPDLLKLLAAGVVEQGPTPTSVDELRFLWPDPALSHWRPIDLPPAGTSEAEDENAYPPELPVPPNSAGHSATSAYNTAETLSSDSTGAASSDPAATSTGKKSKGSNGKKKKGKTAVSSDEGADDIDRLAASESTPQVSHTAQGKRERSASLTATEKHQNKLLAKANKHIRAAQAIFEGSGDSSKAPKRKLSAGGASETRSPKAAFKPVTQDDLSDSSSRDSPETAHDGDNDSNVDNGAGSGVNILYQLDQHAADHEVNLLQSLAAVPTEHVTLAGIVPWLDQFLSVPPTSPLGQMCQRAYQLQQATDLSDGSLVLLARYRDSAWPPSVTDRPVFDKLGRQSQAVYQVTAISEVTLSVRFAAVVVTRGDESGVIQWPTTGDVTITRPTSLFLTPSQDLLRALQLQLQSVAAQSPQGNMSIAKASRPVGATQPRINGDGTLTYVVPSVSSAGKEDNIGKYSSTVAVGTLMQSSKSVVTSPTGMAFQVYKNQEQQLVIHRSMALCAYTDEARLQTLIGSTDYATMFFTAENYRKGADKLWHRVAGRSASAKCPVWSLNLFLLNDDDLEERAVHLLFTQYRNLGPRSVKLWHFLHRSVGMEVTTHGHLRQALEGLEAFLELFFGWTRVFEKILHALRNNELERFSVPYLSMELYSVLCWLRENVDDIRSENDMKKPEVYCQEFIQQVESILTTRLKKEHQDTFHDDCKAAKLLQGGAASSSDSSSEQGSKAGKPNASPAGAAKVRTNTGDKGQLCLADLKHCSKLSKRSGEPFTACEFGDQCNRLHISEVNGGVTKTEAIRQINAFVRDTKVQKELTVWVERQSSFA